MTSQPGDDAGRPPALPARWRRFFWTLPVAASIASQARADDLAAAAPGGSPLVAWLVAASALLAAGAGAWCAVVVLRGRQRLLDELQAARARSRCLEPLLDQWIWETDAEHRLRVLRPPAEAPASAWALAAPVSPVAPVSLVSLCERFAADDPTALRARIDAGAELDGWRGHIGGPGLKPVAGRLSGRPYNDAGGRFAGYHGTFDDDRSREAPPTGATASAAGEPPPAAGEHELLSFTVSHDLRAPIRVVEGFTKIVKEDYGSLLDRVGNDHLDRVLAAAARMNNMIDALMALSRLSSQPLARQPVNLSQLARYVVDDLRRQWPEREVEVAIDADLLASGDPTLLRVVLENLLGNAWKYTGKCTAARISFARRPGAPDTYTIADNGAGFDMRFADRLFGVFQRLHGGAEFPGTGIGLATVRRILRRHGGDIWGEAEVDHGARFHFSIPA